ncbi:MAG: dihydrolipoyl dehydrogenase [Myxococcota bacterium]
MNKASSYDVVVVGGGPGGYVAAARAAALGFKTALVEKDKALGGTCLHRGCIPTKALLHAADVYSDMQHAHHMGMTMKGVSVDWSKIQRNKQRIVDTNAGGVQHLMKSRGVEVHSGFATLKSPTQVCVQPAKKAKPYTLSTKYLLLAVGSAPRPLPFAPFDHKSNRILSSDGVLQLDQIPGSLAIVGGGVIGVEFASVYARFGCQVTILEATDRLLPTADADCSQELAKQFTKQGMQIHTQVQVQDISSQKQTVSVKFAQSNGKQAVCKAQYVLVCIGRAPLTDGIGLQNTQVQLDDKGFVQVNPYMQTHQENIYAIGDCVNTPWLAHVASAEGLLAVQHMANKQPAPLNYDHMPSCVYSDPPVAQCGLTQQQAQQAGYDVKVSKFPFARSGKASILGKKEGFIKLVTDARYGEILGAHMIGPQATELIAEPSFAMQLEATVADLAASVHAHPTLYEAIYEAACMATDQAIHG